eukprot:197754-Chlamydomonas_euryale.AAC.4
MHCTHLPTWLVSKLAGDQIEHSIQRHEAAAAAGCLEVEAVDAAMRRLGTRSGHGAVALLQQPTCLRGWGAARGVGRPARRRRSKRGSAAAARRSLLTLPAWRELACGSGRRSVTPQPRALRDATRQLQPIRPLI